MWTPATASTVLALALALSPALTIAARDSSLGLKASHLHKNGIAFGFIPGWGEAKAPSTATSLNAILESTPMSIVGAYANLKAADTQMKQIDGYVTDMLKIKGPKPPLQIALMPVEGFDNVTEEIAERVAKKMASVNAQGIPVWLRYAHEQNGDWYVWGGQPEAFKKSWKVIATAVRKHAPDTYLLWSPNSFFGGDGATDEEMIAGKRGGWKPYYPGDDQVDIVGLSFYHYGGFERLNKRPADGAALKMMKAFDKLYGSAKGKPMVLSETGASFARNATTGQPSPGGATEYNIKLDWLKQLTSPQLREQVPSYKALCWDENAGGNSPVKTMDFRLITSGDKTLNKDALNYLKSDKLKTCTNRSRIAKRTGRPMRVV
ncbi:glycoside hydrolase family 26 protein [Cystobasidium minutum MCA 4210]|uniref:glycoside hydrolase family 26 protein n=1 Tax=Cystobasidium minutum MCA 4210 TaxID=1397322 RepID=UPI0034CF0003|eukprot:jgi/Rhomi1/207804/estExt_Genemark1.C_1_t20267